MTAIIYAIGYARVSTSKQAAEGDSLDIQAKAIRNEITSNGWALLPGFDVFREPFTGTTDERPVYRSAIQLIRRHRGAIKYFVIRSIDRFSREGSRRYEEMKDELVALGVELRDTTRVIQPKVNSLERVGFRYSWSERSPSAVSEAALSEVHREQRSIILDQLIGTEIELVQAGFHIGNSNDGFVARQVMVGTKKRFAQFPDPERAHFFRQMFEMRADGAMSDPEIVASINAQGFRTRERNIWSKDHTAIVGRRQGKPLCVKQFQAIIKHPIYCGVILKKWTHYKAIRAKGGDSIISIELYNRANRGARFLKEDSDHNLQMMYDYKPSPVKVPRRRYREDFPFKNVVNCTICSRPLLASFSRGRSGKRFGSYHCDRGHPRFGVRQADMQKAMIGLLAELRLSEADSWARIETFLRTAYAEAAVVSEREKRKTANHTEELQQQRDRIVDAFVATTSLALRADLERRAEELDREIEAALENGSAGGASKDDLDEFLEMARDVVEHPAELFENVENIQEQRTLYGLLFDSRPTYQEIINRTPRLSPFFSLVKALEASESSLVRQRGLDVNTLPQEIKRWKSAAWAIAAVSERLPGSKRIAA